MSPFRRASASSAERPGEQSAAPVIERLSRDHGPALLAWARRRFADQRDAEEVVSEALARAWRRYETYDAARGSERAWLFGIARNVASDHYHKSQRHESNVGLDDQRGLDVAIVDGELDRVVELSFLRDAMQSLSPEHRAVVVAAYFHGLSTKQIAQQFGIADGTVKSRLFYALRAVRNYLEEREVLQ